MKNRKCIPGRALAGWWSLLLVLTLSAAAINRVASDATPEEANITRATVALLEHSQFSHHRLDTELSGKFLDRYLDALDTDHLLFRQADLADFDRFRSNLARRTRWDGDTTPALVIFDRYLERMTERTAYITNLLATETFDFTGHETWDTDRRTAPRPTDLTEAQALWKRQVEAEYLQEKLAGRGPDEIEKTLARRYERGLKMMRRLGPGEVRGLYLDALAHVYDPHSDYLGREELQSFNIAMNLSLVGVGATLESRDGYCTIRELVPGGPAARSGLLHPGDRIVAVAQEGEKPVNVIDLPLPQAVDLIRGRKGTAVALTIQPAGADDSVRQVISLVRAEIQLADQRAKASVVEWPQAVGRPLRLGVINLPSFYGRAEDGSGHSSADDVERLIGTLRAEDVEGVLLDLRQNGGGSLEEAVRLTGLFIPRGPVVQTRGPSGDIDVGDDPDPRVRYSGPLIVLTSRFSASASEILAGALQDYGRALVVGDSRTFGKGTVQTLVSLASFFERNGVPFDEDPGAVKVTIRKFYRPSGKSTQLHGVAADLVIPSPTDVEAIGEEEMPDPLPWDVVLPTRYSEWSTVQPILDTLRHQSAARIEADPAFRALRESLAFGRERREAKALSLNEAERRHEQEQAMALETAWKQAVLARSGEMPATRTLTLDNLDTGGRVSEPSPAPSTSASAAATGGGTEDANSLAADDPRADLVLREAESILADYIHLSASPTGPALTARR